MLKWVQTLELDTNKAEKLNSEVEEGKTKLCAGCRRSKKATVAVSFCFDCHEYFCSSCCDFIHAIKALRDHSLLRIGVEQGALNENTQEVIGMMIKCMACAKHPENPVAFLCRVDDRLCCARCAFEDKKNGRNDPEITGLATKEKNDSNADELLDKIQQLITLGEFVIAKKGEMESLEKKETETIVTKIRDIRRKVNDIFDNLEENVLQDCKAASKRHMLNYIEDIEKVKETVKSAKGYLYLLKKSKQEGSVPMVYAVIHNLRKKIRDTEILTLEI